MRRLALCALLVSGLWGLPAMAQEQAGADEAKPYDGGSYTIVPPSSWKLISGSLSPEELAKLPDNISKHYIQRNTDVIFMNIGADPQNTGFKNTLNVVIINEEILLTDEIVKELSSVLKQQYETSFKPFNLEVVEKRKFQDKKDALYVKGSYDVLKYHVTLEQYLVPSSNESVVLTCTYQTDTGQEDGKLCMDAIMTLTFK